MSIDSTFFLSAVSFVVRLVFFCCVTLEHEPDHDWSLAPSLTHDDGSRMAQVALKEGTTRLNMSQFGEAPFCNAIGGLLGHLAGSCVVLRCCARLLLHVLGVCRLVACLSIGHAVGLVPAGGCGGWSCFCEEQGFSIQSLGRTFEAGCTDSVWSYQSAQAFFGLSKKDWVGIRIPSGSPRGRRPWRIRSCGKYRETSRGRRPRCACFSGA